MVQCLIEQDGAPPALIPLHFIGLDGPSYNCIRALPPPSLNLPASFSATLTTCHSSNTWKTPRGEEEEALCRGQRPPAPSFYFIQVKVIKVVIMLQTAVLLG